MRRRYVAFSRQLAGEEKFYVNIYPNSSNGLHEVHWGSSHCVRTVSNRAYFCASPLRKAMSSAALRRVRSCCSWHDTPRDCRISVCRNCIDFRLHR